MSEATLRFFFDPVETRSGSFSQMRSECGPPIPRVRYQSCPCPAFRRWRGEAHEVTYDPEPYALDLPRRSWPEFA